MDGMIDVGSEEHKAYVGIVGCYNSILAHGVTELLENDPSFFVLGVFSHPDSFLGVFEANSADFCLVDTFFLKHLTYGMKNRYQGKCRILLIEDVRLSPKELHSLVIASNVSGIIYKDTDKEVLRKAIFKVLSGELWFDKETFETLFHEAKEVIESKVIFRKLLTPGESRVAQMVCQGLKNKEVAEKLHISENTVKSHLYKIYQKLNIKSRTELMKACMSEF